MMTHLLNTRLFSTAKFAAFTLALLATLLVSACSVHKIDIQQGNVITQEMFEKLKIGMEKQRVDRILGTPLVVDPFHRDRWDYIYIFRAGDTDDKQSAYLSLYFENDRLSKIDVHSELPKEADVKKPGMSLRR
jgi:outer membrane protein assembly factor BamE